MTRFEHYAPGVVIARGAVAPKRCDRIVRGLKALPDSWRKPWLGDQLRPRFDYRTCTDPGFFVKQNRFAYDAAASLDRPCHDPQTCISVYGVGVSLQWHRDNPIVSCAYSLLLNDPAEYQGGRLYVDDGTTGRDRRPVDIGQGDLIAFTSDVEHMVTEVEAGERWVALGMALAAPMGLTNGAYGGRRPDAPVADTSALTLDEQAQLRPRRPA